jgi:hypothetical protein
MLNDDWAKTGPAALRFVFGKISPIPQLFRRSSRLIGYEFSNYKKYVLKITFYAHGREHSVNASTAVFLSVVTLLRSGQWRDASLSPFCLFRPGPAITIFQPDGSGSAPAAAPKSRLACRGVFSMSRDIRTLSIR